MSKASQSLGTLFGNWPPLLQVWKSRLPLIVVPVLAGLRGARGSSSPWDGAECWWQVALLFGISGYTGFLRLPFSVTWWIVLLMAFGLETAFMLGVATALSASVLLSWYSVQVCHPQVVSALWGGMRRCGGKAGMTIKFSEQRGWPQAYWRAWDIFVHGLPACLVLYWHGPSASWDGTVRMGTVGPAAVAAALPLNVLWLWGLGFGLPCCKGKSLRRGFRIWPWSMELAETNIVYRVFPELPPGVWLWIFASHWLTCSLWLSALVLPREVFAVYAICVAAGLFWIPYTEAWWTIFLAALWGNGAWPLLEGIAACCALTTSIGFYGTQVLAPYAFRSLVDVWALQPVQRWAPAWLSRPLLAFSTTGSFMAVARVADFCCHLFPTMTAVFLFWRRATSTAVLAAMPTNVIYLAATGSLRLADTNRIYRVQPNLPGRVWSFIYGSHLAICGLLLCAHSALSAAGLASAA